MVNSLSLRWKYNEYSYRLRKFFKRLIHLSVRFIFEKRLKHFESACRETDRPANSKSQVAFLQGTLRRSLRGLKNEMMSSEELARPSFLRNVRPFRGKFCRKVREFRKISRSELCRLLNAHPEIARLDERYPCFLHYYPFNERFLENLECDISKIVEYCSQGMLFGVGFPTEELARLIAEICNATAEFSEFQLWSTDFILASFAPSIYHSNVQTQLELESMNTREQECKGAVILQLKRKES